jgi:hypothetical protein
MSLTVNCPTAIGFRSRRQTQFCKRGSLWPESTSPIAAAVFLMAGLIGVQTPWGPLLGDHERLVCQLRLLNGSRLVGQPHIAIGRGDRGRSEKGGQLRAGRTLRAQERSQRGKIRLRNYYAVVNLPGALEDSSLCAHVTQVTIQPFKSPGLSAAAEQLQAAVDPDDFCRRERH